jgi:hypothetical protein
LAAPAVTAARPISIAATTADSLRITNLSAARIDLDSARKLTPDSTCRTVDRTNVDSCQIAGRIGRDLRAC